MRAWDVGVDLDAFSRILLADMMEGGCAKDRQADAGKDDWSMDYIVGPDGVISQGDFAFDNFGRARRRLRLVRSIFVLEIERITEACWAP